MNFAFELLLTTFAMIYFIVLVSVAVWKIHSQYDRDKS